MADRKRILTTAAIVMVCLATAVTATGIVVLYRSALAERQSELVALARREARFIETAVRLDLDEHSPEDHASYDLIMGCPKCSDKVHTVLAIRSEAGNFRNRCGKGVEFVVGRRDGNTIRFLLPCGHAPESSDHLPMDVPWDSDLAAPMRLALSGLSGAVEDKDYRGVPVLAAYAPVELLGWGVVAKIDMDEMRAPFVSAAKTTIMIAVLAILMSLVVLRRRLNPLIQRSQESEDQARKALAELSNQKYAIDEHSIVVATDPFGKITYTNDKFCQISQYSREELIGQDHRIVNSGRHPRAFWAEMWETIAGGEVWHGEVCNRAKDGSLYWVETTIVPFKDHAGRTTQYVTIRTDVTERKQAESKVRLLLKSTAEAIYGLDLHGNCTFCNPACIRVLGYGDEADLLGKNMHDLIHHSRSDGTHYPMTECRIYEAFIKGEETHIDNEVLWRANGSPFPAEYWSHPIRQDGNVIGSVVTFLDITERKRAEKDLRASEQRFRGMFEQAAVGVAQIDTTTGRFLRVNKKYSDIVGFTPEEMTATTFMEITHPDDLQDDWDNMERLKLREIREFTMEKRYLCKDGSVVWVNLTVSPMWEPGEKPNCHIAVVEDITERKRTETALRKALAVAESAQSADRAKSEFLANMSHEIRTPMTAILGFAENMLDTDQSEAQRVRCINTIRRNGEHLLGIINDILDLSKIESGRMTIECIASQPCSTIAEVASLMRVRADAKGLPLGIEYIGAMPETIQSDPTRLRQILINLIGNAIKFTEVGTVRLVTQLVNDGDEPYLQFDVIDTGCGMTEEHVAGLFRPFAQADSSTTRKFGGTGLGLTISKRFAEMLGGDIIVAETDPDLGSTFRVTVATGSLEGVRMLEDPMTATVIADTAITVAQVPRSDLQGLRILLAEDGPDNQRLISFVLKKAGADVDVQANGKLALDTVLAARDAGDPFDIILMDIQMPVMDGYEATGLLRRAGYTDPIVALTAHAMEGDREKCIQAGCDGYVSKPVDRKKLVDLILEYLKNCKLKPDPEQTETPQPPSLSGCRVLLAEDNSTNRVLVTGILKKAGADITTVTDGKLALDAALAARDLSDPFDIILMDVRMPVMGGEEATKLLRESGYTETIIAVTAHALQSDGQEFRELGFDDCVTKPFSQAKLIETIRTHFGKTSTDESRDGDTSDALVSNLVDDDMFELIEMFVEELPHKIDAIERALHKQDLVALTMLSHRLKGSAGGYGFPSITDAAAMLESSAQTGEKPATLTQQTRALAELCHRAHDSVVSRSHQ